MQIHKVTPSGFCMGVIKAIDLVRDVKKKHPQDAIYIIGHLVHNHYISDYLKKEGITTLDDTKDTKEKLIASIDQGVVIFTAHGIADDIKAKALKKGLIVYDATCPFVLKTKNLIIDHLKDGYEIFYIGKKSHPEAEAILALSNHIHLIENTDDIKRQKHYPKIFVTNQTTMSIDEIADIFATIKAIFPHALLSDEVCSATRVRQKAVQKIENCDLLYVVGDPSSNNSAKLKEIALAKGIKKVRLIKSAQDISEDDLKGVNEVYVTSGASTPNYLRDQVVTTITAYDKTKELVIPPLDLKNLL